MKTEDITLADNIYHNLRNEIAYLQPNSITAAAFRSEKLCSGWQRKVVLIFIQSEAVLYLR